MAEYRLDELVRRSGISPRNIRAYQERGLLPPPRREGRVAIYDENHRWQLRIIAQLLDKGYTIAHIQDFIEGFAKDLNLADTLGIQELSEKTGMRQALTTPWNRSGRRGAAGGPPQPLRLDRLSGLARKLIAAGIARRDGDDVVLADPDIAAVVDKAKDPTFYLRVLLGVHLATGEAVQRLAEMMIDELRNHLVDHYGEGWLPPVDQQQDLAAVITDVRELAALVVNGALGKALRENAVRAIGEYLEKMMVPADGTVDEFVKAVTELGRG